MIVGAWHGHFLVLDHALKPVLSALGATTTVRGLLVIAMGYDNRKAPGEANVHAWMEQANRGGWTFETARVDAVLALFEAVGPARDHIRGGSA